MKILTEYSFKNNQALAIKNEKVLKVMNDKKMISPYLASSLVDLLKPWNKIQFNLTKDHNSIRMNDFLMNGNIPVTLYSNMLTFGDSNESFKLDGDLLKTMTKYKFNVGHSNPQEQKIILWVSKRKEIWY